MLGSILSGVGAIAGALGGSKGTKAQTTNVWTEMPAAVKKSWLETYLPQVMDYNQLGFQPVPMKRAQAPSSPFDSQALWELQQYSDQMGGYFSPLQGYQAQGQTSAEEEQKKLDEQKKAQAMQAAQMFLATGMRPGQAEGGAMGSNNMRNYRNQYQTTEQLQKLGEMLANNQIGGIRQTARGGL